MINQLIKSMKKQPKQMTKCPIVKGLLNMQLNNTSMIEHRLIGE